MSGNKKVNNTTFHHIITNGPAVYAKQRPSTPEKLKIAKPEFENLICQASKSPWASPLHKVPKRI